MKDAAKRKFNAVVVHKLDRFGRSVLNLSESLAALDSYGVRFISTSQKLDTNASDPASRFLLNILSSVAAFEVEMIRERTLSGIRAAKAKGKTLGRPTKVFRRDEVVRLRGYKTHCTKTCRNQAAELAATAANPESPSSPVSALQKTKD